jgi:hypothetical protein
MEILTCAILLLRFFHRDGSVNVPFLSVRCVETIDSLATSFQIRFNDFRSHATYICIFENPFYVEVMVYKNCSVT